MNNKDVIVTNSFMLYGLSTILIERINNSKFKKRSNGILKG